MPPTAPAAAASSAQPAPVLAICVVRGHECASDTRPLDVVRPRLPDRRRWSDGPPRRHRGDSRPIPPAMMARTVVFIGLLVLGGAWSDRRNNLNWQQNASGVPRKRSVRIPPLPWTGCSAPGPAGAACIVARWPSRRLPLLPAVAWRGGGHAGCAGRTPPYIAQPRAAAQPQSIVRLTPVMAEARSESRNSMVSATSDGSTQRPSAVCSAGSPR